MAAEDAVSPRQFFHGTRENLDEQTHVLPATQTGGKGRMGAFGEQAPLNHVYYTESKNEAHSWGVRKVTNENLKNPVRVYQVEPEDPDPDIKRAARARIIKRVI